MKKTLVAAALAGSLLLAGCEKTEEKVEAPDVPIEDLVYQLSADELNAQYATITSEKLTIIDEKGKETIYDITDEPFFVSIAPYVNKTHTCAVHNLIGCQGEMPNQEFHVQIKDEKGNLVLDETKQSFSNGFIDLWLPRDQKLSVTITQKEKTGTATIGTFKEDKTCITTIQLQ